MTSKSTLAAWVQRPGVVFALILCFCWSLSLAAQRKDSPQPERFISRAVRNITPEQALKYLSEAGVGTASRIPSTNMILITAEPGELTKAKAILELVDSNQPHAIRILPAAGELGEQPLYELLDERIKDISIGSFREQPGRDAESKALVDIHNGSVIVVAKAEQIQTIISALEDVIAEKSGAETGRPDEITAAEPIDGNLAAKILELKPRDVNAPGNDRFFNGLLESLAEAERAEAELKGAETKKPLVQQELTAEPEPVAEPGLPESQEIMGQRPEPKRSEIVELEEEAKKPAFERFSYEPMKIELAEETLELDLPETLNIIDLIDLVGKHLDLDLLYDPAEVKGTVNLRIQDKIKVSYIRCWNLC
jgi:hypothetical protein